ncbi:MAG: hypothetical protein ACXWC9_01520 [Pseudobdellovibrionaceae bacterium]
MKKKTKQPREELIDSLLEDLKDESSNEESLRIGPGGIEASGMYSKKSSSEENNDKTTLLGQEDPTAHYVDEFFISDENRKKPMEEAAKSMAASKPPVSAHEVEYDASEHVKAKPEKIKKQEMPEAKLAAPAVSAKSSGFESQFARAENLKIAQQRILELEQDVEKYRKENEMLTAANEISKNRVEDLISKSQLIEKQKNELKEQNESELRIFKDGLVMKDSEIHRLRSKVEELESRLAKDLRKVRVRERELENRLELAKVEKTALLRAKDETILELKRKTENLQGELEGYQNKIIELNQRIEGNQDQFARTVRALRLALTNLEVNEGTSTSITLTPMKKAD